MSELLGRLYKARRLLRRASRRAATGELTAAIDLASTSVDMFALVAAGNTVRQDEYAVALSTYADLLLTDGDLLTAIAVQDRLVSVLHSSDADWLAAALTRRGDTHRLLAAYESAEVDLRRALDLARSPSVTAAAHNASGILAKDTGRYDEAARHYGLALEGFENVLGKDHPELASLFHNLAGLEHAQGNYEDGEPLARKAIALRNSQGDRDSAELTGDLAVLGAMLAGQRRYAEAEAVFGQTLATWRRLRGSDHYEVAVSQQSLAALHEAQGEAARARDEYRDALRIKRRKLGSAHPEVVALEADVARLNH